MSSRNGLILRQSNNLWYFAEGMFGPLLAVFAERIGGDLLDITWAWAIYLVVTGVLNILVGKLCDLKVFDTAKVMLIGYFINAVAVFGFLLVHNATDLFVVQAGIGLGTALATPTWDALYSKYENPKHFIHSWGLAKGQAEIFMGIAIIIGGLIVKEWGFNFLFITMGSIHLIATFYQARILRK